MRFTVVPLTQGLNDLVAVALVAALTPLVVAVLPGPRIPQVVIFLLGGILIGPHVLGLAETSAISLLANVGLGFLFLLAGYELDPALLRERPGRLAILGWVISAVIALAAAGALTAAGYIKDTVPVALALTTTALGTLLPILRDNDMLGGQFGRYIFAAGAVGELFPILIIAVFLTRRGHFVALASVALVGLLAIVLSAVPWLARNRAVQQIIREGEDATGQTTLRWAVVLLFALLAFASRFGLDVVLGALLAGMVLRAWTRRLNMDVASLEHKFDAVGYGIFIPIFFISSGMTLDLKAIAQDPLRMLLFFLMLLIVRGLPSLLVYRHALPARQRVEMTFITATTLPLLIALAEIGQQDGVMLPATTAALVGAGVLAVLVYPLVAVTLHRSGLTPADAGIAAAQPAAGTGVAQENPGAHDQGDQGSAASGLATARWAERAFPASRVLTGTGDFPVGRSYVDVMGHYGHGTLPVGGRMGRPIIGITGELEAARWGNWIREAVVSPVSYTRAVERAGGTPVILPPVPASSVPVLIDGLNGLVLAGGRDVDPSLYDEAPHAQTDVPDHRRDRFELILTRAAIDADLPFLAIGRGMHILNVARGGTLTQYLPDRLGNESHRPDPVKMTTHDLQISPASQLGRLLGATAQVPAAHYQAVDRIGNGLFTVAWTADQVVEAVEVQGHRWGLGVQWCPEDSDDLRLFETLVSVATAAAAAAAPPAVAAKPEVPARSKRAAKRHAARSS